MAMNQAIPGAGFPRLSTRRSRALFHWRAEDLSLTALSGQVLAFVRATAGGQVPDVHGRMRVPVHSAPRRGMVDTDGDGVRDAPSLRLQQAVTNLCLQSEDFGTTWSPNNTPTRVAAAKTCGSVVLDLIGDDNAGGIEGYFQPITFTADAVKALSLFVAQSSSTKSVIELWDNSASATRCLAELTWNANGTPACAMTGGTFLGYEALGDGVYRLHFQTTSVTAANTNNYRVRPATDAAGSVAPTGTLYAGGCQAENARKPNDYVKTTTGTVTTNLESLTTTLLAGLPDHLTLYARVARPVWADTSGDLGHTFEILTLAGSAAPRLEFALNGNATPRAAIVTFTDGVTPITATQTLVAGSVIELCVQVLNLKTAPQLRLDVGGGFGTLSSASGPITAFANTNLQIGDAWAGATGNTLDAGLLTAKIAAGQLTRAQMAALF